MIVYHGTGSYSIEPILKTGLELRKRNYVKRRCACTTTSLDVAQLFALRRTSGDDVVNGIITGAVLEYELNGLRGKDYDHAKNSGIAQPEHEIAVFSAARLTLVAIHRWHKDRDWVREIV